MGQIDNRTIATNTLFLYFRMAFIMLVNLFVVRAILDILGVVDYGIYNVVGGIVGMFSFLNGTLATSSQRYFSVALANGDRLRLKHQFCLNVSVFVLLILFVIVFAETIGLWYVNTKMTIPQDRLFAANLVYQLTIITFVFQLITVPYNALMIAHEHMKIFAYIGIVEAIFKIIMVIILSNGNCDKLIEYGILMLLSSIIVMSCYYIFCKKNYAESKYSFYWKKDEAKDLIGFSGWHFLGTTSVVIRSQGINLLINAFFSPAVNGARAIAFQISSVVNQFAGNFFVAVKPQMYKSYAAKDINGLVALIFRSTIICVFLVSIIAVPCIINADFILQLWLKKVPEYTVLFTQLVLINAIIDATGNPTICAALATKQIKKFYLYTGTLYILCLPISYIALKLGYDASITMVISSVISVIAVFSRVIILKQLFPFPLKNYIILFVKEMLLTVSIIIVAVLFKCEINNSIIAFIGSSIVSVILHIVCYYYVIIDKQDRIIISDIVKKKILRR